MRVLICGSRTWTDTNPIFVVLDGLDGQVKDAFLTVIEGGATGADSLAAMWANTHENPGLECYPADWKKHGRAAGAIRNKRMLEQGEPDLVVAFTEQPPTAGTSNMIQQAKKAGVPVWVVSHG